MQTSKTEIAKNNKKLALMGSFLWLLSLFPASVIAWRSLQNFSTAESIGQFLAITSALLLPLLCILTIIFLWVSYTRSNKATNVFLFTLPLLGILIYAIFNIIF